MEVGGEASLCHEALQLALSGPTAAERGGGGQCRQCRLHVIGTGWQERHGGLPGSKQSLVVAWGGGLRTGKHV